MSAPHFIPRVVLDQTFWHFRQCGQGCRECQVLWVSPWQSPDGITQVIHPRHTAHGGGFLLDNPWLDELWRNLAATDMGIRVQVHTHPRTASHSPTDDMYPIIHTPGFLSLVIPDFGLGTVGFDHAFLTEIQSDGTWREVPISSRLIVT